MNYGLTPQVDIRSLRNRLEVSEEIGDDLPAGIYRELYLMVRPYLTFLKYKYPLISTATMFLDILVSHGYVINSIETASNRGIFTSGYVHSGYGLGDLMDRDLTGESYLVYSVNPGGLELHVNLQLIDLVTVTVNAGYGLHPNVDYLTFKSSILPVEDLEEGPNNTDPLSTIEFSLGDFLNVLTGGITGAFWDLFGGVVTVLYDCLYTPEGAVLILGHDALRNLSALADMILADPTGYSVVLVPFQLEAFKRQILSYVPSD